MSVSAAIDWREAAWARVGRRRVSPQSWICAAIGVLTPLTVKAGGNFPLAEWFLAPVALFAVLWRIARHRWPAGAGGTRWFSVLLVLQLIGLAAYVWSDEYRGSAPTDYLRGWARMAFVAVDLTGLALLVGPSWRRWIALVAGLSAGEMLQAVLFGPLFGDWWKFGFALPLTYLTVIVAYHWGRLVTSLAAVVLAGIHLLLNFRSLGLECLMLAVLLHFHRLPKVARFAGVVLVCAGIGVAVTGSFNDKAAVQVSRHSSDAERRAMLEVAAGAFLDSPLIGQGSWFSATHLVRKIEARRLQLGDDFHGYTPEQENELSVHSQLLTALAEGGIFGGGFFLAYGAMLLWALFYCLRSERTGQAIVLLIVIEALWNLAISPFSGPARVTIAAAAVLALLLWQQSRGRLPAA